MLLLIVIALILFHRSRWYGYGPYWGYPAYRGYGPHGPVHYGYAWNGYAWQPHYGTYYGPNGAGWYGVPYGYGPCRRGPFSW